MAKEDILKLRDFAEQTRVLFKECLRRILSKELGWKQHRSRVIATWSMGKIWVE